MCNNGTEAQEEPSAHESTEILRWTLHRRADEDDQAAYEHADASTVAIVDEATEGERAYIGNVVNDKDQAGALPGTIETEAFMEGSHGVDGAHERTIYTDMSAPLLVLLGVFKRLTIALNGRD